MTALERHEKHMESKVRRAPKAPAPKPEVRIVFDWSLIKSLRRRIANLEKDLEWNAGQRPRRVFSKRGKGMVLALDAWRSELMSGLSCDTCGADHPAVLLWHHNDPKKKVGGMSVLCKRGDKVVVFSELAKCRVLCCNCHAILHVKGRS